MSKTEEQWMKEMNSPTNVGQRQWWSNSETQEKDEDSTDRGSDGRQRKRMTMVGKCGSDEDEKIELGSHVLDH